MKPEIKKHLLDALEAITVATSFMSPKELTDEDMHRIYNAISRLEYIRGIKDGTLKK